jgi:hypothetical protein
MANHVLANDNTNNDERQAVCDMLESILRQTGNDNGFLYVPTTEVEGAGTRRHYMATPSTVDDYWAARHEAEEVS